jgi:hypothetical protein
MVCHVNDGLLDFIAHELHFIFHAQDPNFPALCSLLCPSCVDDAGFHRARIALIAVLAAQRKLDALAALQLALEASNRPGANQFRALPDLLGPALVSAVKGIGLVIHVQLVGLPVQGLDDAAGNAVGDAPDRLAEVGAVMDGIMGFGREALHNIRLAHNEGLDNGARRQKHECGGGHGGEFGY